MNVIVSIEDNLDFNTLLQESLSNETQSKETCYITNEPLETEHITLSCGHTFNYKPIYFETIQQKSISKPGGTSTLLPWELKCPYCRHIQSTILPYRKIDGVEKIVGINAPKRYTMQTNKCKVCNNPSHDDYCNEHVKLGELCVCDTLKGTRCKNKGIYTVEENKLCKIHYKMYEKKGIDYLYSFKHNIMK